MFKTQLIESNEVIRAFAFEFQKCLYERNQDYFKQLVDHNTSGYDSSFLLSEKIEVSFKNPAIIDSFGEGILSEKGNVLSVYFYVEFEGEFRPAIVEFDLKRIEDGYEVTFSVFKPS